MKTLLATSSFLAISAGILMLIGGFWSLAFTYQNVARENIVTPDDASIPATAVRGPFTLKSQADVIRKHTLKRTDGQSFAQMPRQVAKVDDAGEPVLDADGNAVMVPNEARDMWITATTLMTALHLGIITYVFSALIILFGLVSIWTGFVFGALSKRH